MNLNNALGRYHTAQTDIVKSLVNAPAGLSSGGEITVDWYPAMDDDLYGTQILRQAKAGVTYIYARSKITTSTWGIWDAFIKNADLVSTKEVLHNNTKNYTLALGWDNSGNRLSVLVDGTHRGWVSPIK